MATIKRFEDLEIWKMARNMNKEIYKLTNEGKFSRDFSLKDQIERAAGSVMDNIAEGFERSGNKEFVQFLYISKGSNGEVRSQLYRAIDKGYIQQNKFDEIYNQSNHIGVSIQNFIDYLTNSGMKGRKYKSTIK